jgi:hypothetical protein
MAARFRQEHPLEARVADMVIAEIGAKDTFCDPVDLFSSFPMIAFRPQRLPSPVTTL